MKQEKAIKVRIFDTTLRDGQQSPGAGMSFAENLEYARLASKLGVDVLEAGFPSASKTDFQIVRTIAEELAADKNSPIIAALCQLRREQFEKTIEALQPSIPQGKALLHVYLPVAEELIKASLQEKAADLSKLVEDVATLVKMATTAGCRVELSPEGYSRMGANFDFTTDIIRAAVESGAEVINCPDTIGGGCWLEGSSYFVESMKKHAAIIAEEYPEREVIWSTHCHNDFGLAVANSINCVVSGPARQIEGCFNGVGERAGNAALEQCIMIIKQFGRGPEMERHFYTDIKTEHLKTVSDFVDKHMLARQAHYPVTGLNAAKHSAGGHTNAILNNPLIYQPFNPAEVGNELSFVFGPLSGSNHAQSVINSCGYKCEENEKQKITQFIKDSYADRRKGITDEELLEAYLLYRTPIKVAEFEYSKSANQSSVKIKGKVFDVEGEIQESSEGEDSALAALNKILSRHFGPICIESHRSESDSAGIDARSISRIVIRDKFAGVYEGVGADRDIEISALKALIAAVNTAYIERTFKL